MKSLRDQIDEAITACLIADLKPTASVHSDTGNIVIKGRGSAVHVDKLIDAVMHAIRDNAA
jgi:hypothetical protein